MVNLEWPPSARWALAALGLLVVLATILSGCGVAPAVAEPVTDPPPSPPPAASVTLSPTRAALPTVLAAATSNPPHRAAVLPAATTTASPAPTATATPASTSTPTPLPTPTPVPTTALTQDIIHILLIGGDSDYVLDMNTDTLIVVVVNRATNQVSMLSIPRDLWVHIPTYGWGRINTAHRIGQRNKYEDGKGPGLLARTIEENLGLPIDHWVRIGYQGFARAVDEVGGVDMMVPCRVNLRFKPPTSEDEQEIILEPGVHHMDGATALRYVRTRRGDSDFERAGRQQRFLRAVWDQFKSPDTVLKLPGLWSALKDSFQTDLKLGDVLALAPVALELRNHRLRSLYIGRGQLEGWTTPEGWRVQVPIPEKVQAVVERLYAPPAADDRVADAAARVRVRNGTGRPQLGLIAADQLRWQGFEIVDTGPADRADYATTQILVYNEKPEALARLAAQLNVRPKHITHQPDPNQPADFYIILGADYDPCQ